MAMERSCLLLAALLVLGSAFHQVSAEGAGAQKLADILVALEKEGKYNSFLFALKATGIDGELAKLLNNYDVGVTILAADDSAFPDTVEARNAYQVPVDLHKVIASHIIMEYLPSDRLVKFAKNHMFATLSRPLHVVHEGALSASAIGREGTDQPVSFSHMRGAVASIAKKDIYDDGNISVQGVEMLLLPSAVTTP